MNISIIGYGKMGKEVEKQSLKRGHSIYSIIEKDSLEKNIIGADVAINFCTPETAHQNIAFCLKNNIPVVSGTTGWLSDLDKIKKLSEETKTSFLYSSNFSLGMNLFFKLNKKLAEIMHKHDYDLSIDETHHTEKKDSPSGTSISLAEDIIQYGKFNSWSTKSEKNSIKIKSNRFKDSKGEHIVNYSSDIDEIEIRHFAKKRKGFALGAIMAAEWILDKKGVFDMNDFINDINN